MLVGIVFSLMAAFTPPSWGAESAVTAKGIDGVGVVEQTGHSIDLQLPFVDDVGQKVTLGDYFNSGKPVLMAIVYYTCPELCNYHLSGLTEAMNQLRWTAGKDYQLVMVSMNPKEGPKEAAEKKATYLKMYNRPGAAQGWHFLTGSQASVQDLAKDVGFQYKWDAKDKQYAHVSVAYILSPEGRVFRYLYGVQVSPKTLRLSLVEASGGKIGSLLDQALLYCFHFDPSKNRYTLYAWSLAQVAAVLLMAAIGLLLIPGWMKERAQGRKAS